MKVNYIVKLFYFIFYFFLNGILIRIVLLYILFVSFEKNLYVFWYLEGLLNGCEVKKSQGIGECIIFVYLYFFYNFVVISMQVEGFLRLLFLVLWGVGEVVIIMVIFWVVFYIFLGFGGFDIVVKVLFQQLLDLQIQVCIVKLCDLFFWMKFYFCFWCI